MGHGKTKPNSWVENSPKMKNLHRWHCLQKLANMKKVTKPYRLGFNGPPISIQSVKLISWLQWILCSKSRSRYRLKYDLLLLLMKTASKKKNHGISAQSKYLLCCKWLLGIYFYNLWHLCCLNRSGRVFAKEWSFFFCGAVV